MQNTSSCCHSSFLTWIVREEPSLKIFLKHKILSVEGQQIYWAERPSAGDQGWIGGTNWITWANYEWAPERAGLQNQKYKICRGWEPLSLRCLRGWYMRGSSDRKSCARWAGGFKLYYTWNWKAKDFYLNVKWIACSATASTLPATGSNTWLKTQIRVWSTQSIPNGAQTLPLRMKLNALTGCVSYLDLSHPGCPASCTTFSSPPMLPSSVEACNTILQPSGRPTASTSSLLCARCHVVLSLVSPSLLVLTHVQIDTWCQIFDFFSI